MLTEQNRRYWDTMLNGKPIAASRTGVLETLPRVLASPPKIAWKSSASTLGAVYYRARASWRAHPWLTAMSALAVAAACFVWWRRQRRRARGHGHGRFFNLDGSERAGNGVAKYD
jgi:protein disulfide-isomerase